LAIQARSCLRSTAFQGGPVGEAGVPVSVRLDRQNYKTYLQPPQ
jgi:hypothetical protein